MSLLITTVNACLIYHDVDQSCSRLCNRARCSAITPACLSRSFAAASLSAARLENPDALCMRPWCVLYR